VSSFADQAFGLDPLQQVEPRKSQKNLRDDRGLVNYQAQAKTSKKEGKARPPANDNNDSMKDVSNR